MKRATGAKGEGQAALGKHEVAQLITGYSEESMLYQMLFGLTSRQRRCLGDGGDLSEFIELIDQKDSVLNQIEQLEHDLEPLRARWINIAAAHCDKLVDQLNPVLDEIVGTIQRTVSIEHDNERLLETRRRELSKALCDARHWRCGDPDPIPADTADSAVNTSWAVRMMA